MTEIQIGSNAFDDWELVAQISKNKPAGLSLIPRFDLEVQLNSDFIAVEVVASNQKDTWVNGGYISQVYAFDGFEMTPQQHFLTVNQITLVELKQLSQSDFGLIYDPPKYFRDVAIRIWKYNGVQTNLLLQQIAATLANITVTATVDLDEVNRKLDQIIINQQQNANVDFSVITTKLDAICNRLDNLSIPSQPPQISKKKRFFICN